jgi:hypothetical protein
MHSSSSTWLLIAAAAIALAACGNPPVHGTVVKSDGTPLADVDVLIPGLAPGRTDASGAFDFKDVPRPYGVVVHQPGSLKVVLYSGLTRDDPVISFSPASSTGDDTRSATISGRLSGGPSVGWVQLVYDAPGANSFAYDVASPNSTFSMQQYWYTGQSSCTGTLHAFQTTTDGMGHTNGFLAHGARENVTLVNGMAAANQDIALSAIAQDAISGHVSAPPGYTLQSKEVELKLSEWRRMDLVSLPSGDAAFQLPVPVLDGAVFTVYASATAKDGSGTYFRKNGVSAGESGISAILKQPPQPLSPPFGAGNVNLRAGFRWTSQGRVIYRVNVVPVVPTDLDFTLWTEDTDVAIPSLASLGLSLPQGVEYEWQVWAYSPGASVDDMLVPGFERKGEQYYARSRWHPFTTAR